MNIEERIRSFSALGEHFRNFASNGRPSLAGGISGRIGESLSRAETWNPWFTRENLIYAIQAWGDLLTTQNLTDWLSVYAGIERDHPPKRVGVVMAGNIPLVGFHDLLCVLLSGHSVLARLSSDDESVLPVLGEILADEDERWKERITFTSGKLSGFDAVIATGSNNTSRYFEYYFGKYPHIIRKNRSAVAILYGHETDEDLAGLGNDLFRYFGLGCRSVSKLFLPEGYDPGRLKGPFSVFGGLGNHNKFRNNYDYHKALFLINRTPFIDGGFFLLKKDESIFSPVGVVYFEPYTDPGQIYVRLEEAAESIQCVVAKDQDDRGFIPPGSTQHPALGDYADGVDTMRFLTENI